MRLTIAQLNPTIGDTPGNLAKLEAALERARSDSSELLVLSELFLTGYPPRDLLERKWFIDRATEALGEVVRMSKAEPDIGILVGVPTASGSDTGCGLHNSAVLISNGEIVFMQHKALLPTYDVFDEARYFDPASEIRVFRFKGESLGVSICEDAWNDPELRTRRHYETDPIQVLAAQDATLFINISSSPYNVGKEAVRFRLVSSHAKRHGIPFVFVNQVGANDELIFDGRSIFVDKNGDPVEVLPEFREVLLTIDTSTAGRAGAYQPVDRIRSMHDALVLGIGDYMRKCGFRKAVVGLSGGIDSAVTCALAVSAVGAENVMGVTMPSPFSAEESAELSEELASNLRIEFRTVPISDIYQAYVDSLGKALDIGPQVGVTLENVQARIRGNILMAISNEYGHLVLSTGNKSELAVGYCTLYGDMSGGLAVLSDVPKTMVYGIAEFINAEKEVIPQGIIDRVPSAELRPNQTDQDTLPPYPVLDEILRLYIDEERSVEEIIGEGFESETVKWVVRAVNRNEYKRRQAAPGLKVTSKAFGMGRRMVIAAKYDL